MSKLKGEAKGTAGAEIPEGNVVLEGEIVTASAALMADENYEKGYPDQSGALHMRSFPLKK